MSNETNEVQRASARLGGLSTYGRTPNPETLAAAQRSLACARIDREIRNAATVSPPLEPVQIGHICGLLVGWGGSEDGAVERLERAIREAVYAVPRLTAEDRERIAKIIAAGGAE